MGESDNTVPGQENCTFPKNLSPSRQLKQGAAEGA
jgi:hypothetical protein